MSRTHTHTSHMKLKVSIESEISLDQIRYLMFASFHSFIHSPIVRIEQGELDGLMIQNPHLMHSRQQRHFTTQPHSHSSGIQLPQPMQQSHYHRQEQHSHPSQQHSSSGTTDLQSKYYQYHFHRFTATVLR